MAINLFRTFSTIRINVHCGTRLTSSIRYLQTLKSPLKTPRYHDSISKPKLLTFKFRSALPIITPVRHVKQEAYAEINTDIVNNVILWKFEYDKYFRRLTIFSTIQLSILICVSFVMFSYLSNYNKYKTLKEYVTDNSIVLLASSMAFLTGIGAAFLLWFFVTRSLKYIILNKGGKAATLISYHPFKKPQSHIVPVDDIVVAKGRRDKGQYMSLKVKNTKFYFLIDKTGTFVNPQLFDNTIGLMRKK